MSYQLGIAGLMRFKRMWAAIEKEDWILARSEMLDSRWAKYDSPERALEMADKFLSG
jgi:lysozyme